MSPINDSLNETKYNPIEDEELSESDSDLYAQDRQRTRNVKLSTMIMVTLVQFAIWIGTIFYFRHTGDESHIFAAINRKDLEGYYPALDAVQLQEVRFAEDRSYWTMDGLPTKEIDALWMKLMGSREGMVQMSPSDGFDLSRLPSSLYSEQFPDRHGYGFEMHHQLHCLNRIRQSFYPSHYFQNESQWAIAHHREHCLDHLRQSILCHGDFALDYWRYNETDNRAHLKVDVMHVCRDSSKLYEWAEEHRWNSGWARDPAYPDRDLRGTGV